MPFFTFQAAAAAVHHQGSAGGKLTLHLDHRAKGRRVAQGPRAGPRRHRGETLCLRGGFASEHVEAEKFEAEVPVLLVDQR